MTMTNLDEEEEYMAREIIILCESNFFALRFQHFLKLPLLAGWAPEVVADGSFTDPYMEIFYVWFYSL